MLKKFRVYCDDCDGFEETGYVSDPPTECPTCSGSNISDIVIINAESSVLNNIDATSDPTSDDDIVQGYGSGSFWFNTTDKTKFICEDPSEGQAVWRFEGNVREVHIECGGLNVYYSKVDGDTLTDLRRFIFSGTKWLGTPIAVRFLVAAPSGGADIRLYDMTNNNTIAIKQDFTTNGIITDLSTSNWPEDSAILSVQGRCNQSDETLYIADTVIIY